ncbi:MAG: NAD(P)-binding protein [Phycisphaeraceae bacterium]|nr:NAD(P)-binding protein [Phycisphaeraceae bacterium]
MNTSPPEPSDSPDRHAIVAGYGPVGRAVTAGLEAAGVEVTVLELNEATVKTQAELGRSIVHGDATVADDLRRANLERAQALILAIPDEQSAVRACEVAREVAPEVFISARTNFVSQGLEASRLGADHVTIEEIATAEHMRNAVLDRLDH